jgi:hypothetical protein
LEKFCNLQTQKGGQKVCKRRGQNDFNSSNFLKNLISKKSRKFSSKAVFFLIPSPPPPTPLILFGKLLCGLGFLAWNGIVTLWTSTSAKGGVYAATVHFFLADGDLQQRE